MAIPRVFISSTCYDLKHIRENLKYFVRTIGYEPVLSDDGDVYYSPSSHTHDSCLKEVSTCQIFVLIIGGRYGGGFKDTDSSITNNEYREAVKGSVPVFALIESSVYSDHHLYKINLKKDPKLAERITYPSCDNKKIFRFIDEVRKQSVNNALFPFKDFSDIESYLKKQWAGMMYDFLDQRSEDTHSRVTNRLLDDLSLATRKSEELIKVLLKTTSSDTADETIKTVSNKVEAEKFIKSVFNRFGIDRLEEDLREIESDDLEITWYEFLESTGAFYIDDIEHEDELRRVIWGPSSRGVQIGHYEGDKFIFDNDHELEKSYEAFKSVDKETREGLISKLVNGF